MFDHGIYFTLHELRVLSYIINIIVITLTHYLKHGNSYVVTQVCNLSKFINLHYLKIISTMVFYRKSHLC
jgi:hypothetical protein